MNTHADRTPENKNRSVSTERSQKPSGDNSTFEFIDNRPEVGVQRKLKEMVNNSPRTMQLRAFQDMADNSLQAKQPSYFQSIKPVNPVIQRAPHRPDQGTNIRYLGQIWTVIVSAINNPQITIRRAPNNTQHIDWAAANYTIIREDTDQDHDLRENDLGAGAGPVDAYAGLSTFDYQAKVRKKFSNARDQALIMIKNTASQHINHQASQASLNAISLTDFEITRKGPTLIGAGKAKEAAQWELTWIEGSADNLRRTWRFIIDSDNPLPTSSQDPHVGWTVSAAPGTQGAIQNTFGHVWLDHVPVMR
jgi:hypothetical protein